MTKKPSTAVRRQRGDRATTREPVVASPPAPVGPPGARRVAPAGTCSRPRRWTPRTGSADRRAADAGAGGGPRLQPGRAPPPRRTPRTGRSGRSPSRRLGGVDLLQPVAGLGHQRVDLRPLERDRGALGVVLVVEVGVERRRDDVAVAPGQVGQQRQHLAPLGPSASARAAGVGGGGARPGPGREALSGRSMSPPETQPTTAPRDSAMSWAWKAVDLRAPPRQPREVHADQVGAGQVGLGDVRRAQGRPPQVAAGERGLVQVGLGEVGLLQVDRRRGRGRAGRRRAAARRTSHRPRP